MVKSALRKVGPYALWLAYAAAGALVVGQRLTSSTRIELYIGVVVATTIVLLVMGLYTAWTDPSQFEDKKDVKWFPLLLAAIVAIAALWLLWVYLAFMMWIVDLLFETVPETDAQLSLFDPSKIGVA